MFKRLKKHNILQKYILIFSSLEILKRIGKYYSFRIARIGASSHTIALGFAIGVAVSFSPLVGLHFLSTILFCFILRGSIMAGLLGSLLGNPWTWPMIWVLSYKLSTLLGVGGHPMTAHDIHTLGKDFGHAVKHLKFKRLWHDIWPIFYKVLVGTIPLGVVCGMVFYFPLKGLVNKIRIQLANRRMSRIAKKKNKNSNNDNNNNDNDNTSSTPNHNHSHTQD